MWGQRYFLTIHKIANGLPWWLSTKEPACWCRIQFSSVQFSRSVVSDSLRPVGSIPGSGRSPGEGNGNPLQYSFLGNPMDRRTWHQKSWTWLSDWTTTKKTQVILFTSSFSQTHPVNSYLGTQVKPLQGSFLWLFLGHFLFIHVHCTTFHPFLSSKSVEASIH